MTAKQALRSFGYFLECRAKTESNKIVIETLKWVAAEAELIADEKGSPYDAIKRRLRCAPGSVTLQS